MARQIFSCFAYCAIEGSYVNLLLQEQAVSSEHTKCMETLLKIQAIEECFILLITESVILFCVICPTLHISQFSVNNSVQRKVQYMSSMLAGLPM